MGKYTEKDSKERGEMLAGGPLDKKRTLLSPNCQSVRSGLKKEDKKKLQKEGNIPQRHTELRGRVRKGLRESKCIY